MPHRSRGWRTPTSARGRGYPGEAVRWLAGDRPCDVLDLGAGTGKLTRSLAAVGHRVTAVEPLEPMLLQLRAAVPGIDAFLGSAEIIPLPDGSVNVVTCAQAFHWFDHALALPEIARVLRPGGRLALIWNMRDEREPWVDELSDAMVGRTGFVHTASDTIERSGLYGPVERAVFDHVQEIDRGALQELVICAATARSFHPRSERRSLRRSTPSSTSAPVTGSCAFRTFTECFRARLATET